MNRTALLALILLGACSKPDAPPAATDAASVATIVDPAAAGAADVAVPPADTMAFRMKEGTEVWLTAGRVGRGTDGVPCRERGVELRKGEVRKVVPLLYVTTAPRDRNDSLFARLSTDCVSTGTYSIDIVSGQPTPFERSR